MEYLILKLVHVISATLLFGTGIGSAFYLLCVVLRRDVHVIAGVARLVVIADWLFTPSTAVLQPLTGLYLVHLMQLPLATPWIGWSLALYGVAIACWLPVVWLQMRMRDAAAAADRSGEPLPSGFWRSFAWWVALGVVAFVAFLAIFYLMIFKPA